MSVSSLGHQPCKDKTAPLPLLFPEHLLQNLAQLTPGTTYFLLSRLCMLRHVQLFVTPCQAPLSMEFFREEYWEWVAISFFRGSFPPKDWTHISCLTSGFLSHLGWLLPFFFFLQILPREKEQESESQGRFTTSTCVLNSSLFRFKKHDNALGSLVAELTPPHPPPPLKVLEGKTQLYHLDVCFWGM